MLSRSLARPDLLVLLVVLGSLGRQPHGPLALVSVMGQAPHTAPQAADTPAEVPPARDQADAFHPDQSKLPAPAPADAIVLFDGSNAHGGADHLFVSMSGETANWPIVDS